MGFMNNEMQRLDISSSFSSYMDRRPGCCPSGKVRPLLMGPSPTVPSSILLSSSVHKNCALQSPFFFTREKKIITISQFTSFAVQRHPKCELSQSAKKKEQWSQGEQGSEVLFPGTEGPGVDFMKPFRPNFTD
jgi:hypothetical protein